MIPSEPRTRSLRTRFDVAFRRELRSAAAETGASRLTASTTAGNTAAQRLRAHAGAKLVTDNADVTATLNL